MKCVDAIEGTVKNVLKRIHQVSIEDNLDDTEYVRNVKAVIDGTDQFLKDNPELVGDPQLLKEVLFNYSRTLWLKGYEVAEQTKAPLDDTAKDENEEYQTYYYDYIYHRGVYPR